MRLVLASGSQRRRELMSMCGYDYEIVVSNADEHISENDPEQFVKTLALRKAEEVFERLAKDSANNEQLAVIGSDTVVAFDGKIIGKPNDEADAARILSMLSGKTHRVYTGVAVKTYDNTQIDCSTTDVTFASLLPEEIEAYILSGEPMDKAGAYGIQGPFGMFVERVEGNYFNVIGLPLPMLYKMLKNIGCYPIMRRV